MGKIFHNMLKLFYSPASEVITSFRIQATTEGCWGKRLNKSYPFFILSLRKLKLENYNKLL